MLFLLEVKRGKFYILDTDDYTIEFLSKNKVIQYIQSGGKIENLRVHIEDLQKVKRYQRSNYFKHAEIEYDILRYGNPYYNNYFKGSLDYDCNDFTFFYTDDGNFTNVYVYVQGVSYSLKSDNVYLHIDNYMIGDGYPSYKFCGLGYLGNGVFAVVYQQFTIFLTKDGAYSYKSLLMEGNSTFVCKGIEINRASFKRRIVLGC